MNEQWNKDIQNRLKDFPKKAPEGLLDDIKKEMTRRGFSSTTATSKSHTIIFRISSIAAVILILLGISYLFQWKETPVLPEEYESMILPTEEKNMPIPTEEVPESRPTVPSSPRSVAQVIIPEDTVSNTKPTTIEEPESKKEEEKEASEKHLQEPEKKPQPTFRQEKWAYTPSRKKKSSFDIGAYYSGIVTQALQIGKGLMADGMPGNSNSTLGSPLPPPNNDPNTNNGGLDSTLIAKSRNIVYRRKNIIENANHHLPIRLGISFRYNLNKRWNIQSGLTYSYLTSDISAVGKDFSSKTKQKLHYIGIPIQAGYRIWESKRFRGYISAGGQVEKLVSGKAITNYRENNSSQRTSTQSLSDKRLLFSALAAVGAEYALGKDFSLYAEPGIHYYFNNGSEIQTYYNEEPLNIHITVGFRFHWNK